MDKSKPRFVVVTTDSSRRGVFAGILLKHEDDKVVLKDAQMCVYWSAETRGVLGLAANGPAKGSRIGPPMSCLEINGVTAIIDATKEAEAKWKQQPWA